jgi:hypothetical protein
MLRRIIVSIAIILALVPCALAKGKHDQPQTIKLERFRKALWKVHLTVKGKPGDFLAT